MKNNNWSKGVKEGFNKPRRHFNKPQEKQFRGASVEVRNDDVNGAIRRLKKILERDDRQSLVLRRSVKKLLQSLDGTVKSKTKEEQVHG
jgi:ribosomal protein S21